MKYLFIVIIGFLSIHANAQKDSTSSKKDSQYSWKFEKERMTFGGGIGGSLGERYSSVNVSPLIGYKFTDKFFGGTRLIYNYYSVPNRGGFSNYGYGILSRYFIKSNIFAHAEYQDIFYKGNNSNRIRIPAILIGGGYYNRPITFSVLYDLLWDPNSVYPTPFRVNFGLMF